MNYQTYKNRSIDFTKEVKIYKNLHNGLFSVMQNNLVVAHIESFEMSQVVFKVSESGRQRVINEQRKNVHAFLVGKLLSINNTDNDLIISNYHTKIRYDPYVSGSFLIGINNTKCQGVYNLIYGCNKFGLCAVF